MTPLQVPYVDLARQHRAIRDELLAAASAVLEHGQFILGPEVSALEQRLASYCGVKEAVSVGSGTDALLLALRALGIGPGDEVITVPNSFVATAAAIVLAGATPVFIDVDETYLLDPKGLERALTARTKAILPVHLTGRAAEMKPIRAFARQNGLRVIEDCAQAIGAEYYGEPVGGFGDAGCFSLHPLKTLNACGDGGLITTDDPVLASQLRELRNFGLRSRGCCESWSGNSRLDTLQAAFLITKLRYLDKWTERRRQNAELYRQGIGDVTQVRLPRDPDHIKSVYHTFVIQAENRDALRSHLEARGVGTAVHYPVPLHLQPCSRALGYGRGSFPVAEAQAQAVLSLPIYPELSPDELELVVDAIRQFYRESGA